MPAAPPRKIALVSELDGWTTCPRCRAALEPDDGAVRCAECGLVVYARPSPAVCALIVDDRGRVLLARRAEEPAKGLWDILGGFMDEFEQPLDALRREMREELDVEIEPLDFVAAVADRYGEGGNATLNLCWTARIVAGTPRPSDELAELRWFEPDDLPARGDFAFPNCHEILAAWRR
jgi:ADP-ribose pyrophosphatase YjhB (NUDIX family)